MFHALAEKITDQMVAQQVVEVDKREIYEYGLEYFIASATHLVMAMIIGLSFGMLGECLVFLASYLLLRGDAGGLHAESHTVCFWMSCLVVIVVMGFFMVVPVAYYQGLVTVFLPVALLVIFILTPVEDHNKPLDEVEVAHYRRKTRKILGLEAVVLVVLLGLGLWKWAFVMTTGLSMLATLMILGFWKNKRYQTS